MCEAEKIKHLWLLYFWARALLREIKMKISQELIENCGIIIGLCMKIERSITCGYSIFWLEYLAS
jgi:hypothetical protein